MPATPRRRCSAPRTFLALILQVAGLYCANTASAAFRVDATVPASAAVDVPPATAITVNFNAAVSNLTVGAASFAVRSRFGPISGSYSFPSSTQAQFTAGAPFPEGERIDVVLSTNILSQLGSNLVQHTFLFDCRADGCTNFGYTLIQSLGVSTGKPRSAVFADIDADGDLDAVIGNANQSVVIYTNDGTGTFADSGQAPSAGIARDTLFGDFDADGDLDAWVARRSIPSRSAISAPVRPAMS